MSAQKSILSVTCATPPSLLQLMREKRMGASIAKIETAPIPSPVSISFTCTLPQVIQDWIEICLSEGHIQPSQCKVGRLEGWPIRPYLKHSLYIDFFCLCRQQGISDYLIPSEALFYEWTDLIFDGYGSEKYQFPTLEICRERFANMNKEILDDNEKTTGS